MKTLISIKVDFDHFLKDVMGYGACNSSLGSFFFNCVF